MHEPWRAVRQRRLGGKDGEAFGTPVYSAAPRSASKVDEINVPVPFSCSGHHANGPCRHLTDRAAVKAGMRQQALHDL